MTPADHVPVRRADRDDWRAVRDVRLRALADAPGAFAATLEREEALPDDEWRRRVTTSAWFLARSPDGAGDPVGVACGIVEPADPSGRHLVGMWVEQTWRGTRVADRLVGAVAEWAVEQGAATLALWVVDGNARARRFYERLGFAPTGDRGPLPSDPDVLESRMIRSLSDPRSA